MKDRPTTIVRAKRSDTPYFMMSRETAQDKNLSWAARGILTYLLSKPDDWRVNVKDLQQGCGRDKVYSIIDELIKYRYMERSKGQTVEYVVHEIPLPENTEVEIGLPENPYTEFPDQENTDTYIVENKEQITESTEKTPAPAPTTETPKVSSDNRPNPVENARADGKTPALEESSEPQKKSSGKRKVSDVPPAGDPALDAITILCYGTKDAYFPNSKRIRNCYRDVAKVGGPPTIEELRGFYLWWKREDWRGQKGQAPKPNQVSELWATFKSALKGVNPDVQFLEKTGTDGAKSKVWGWSGK